MWRELNGTDAMPTKTVEPADAWSLKAQQKQWFPGRAGYLWVPVHGVADRGVRDAAAESSRQIMYHRILALRKRAKRVRAAMSAKTCGKGRKTIEVGGRARKAIEIARREGSIQKAICKLIRYDGVEAVCEVELDGYRLSGVSFPAGAVRAKQIQPGDRFTWAMRDSGPIRRADIGPRLEPVRDRLTTEQRAELESLYSDSRRREAEGEEWTEYSGPGQ